MFNNQRYITRGVADSVEPFCQLLIWDMIDNLNIKKDYLQIFLLEWKNGKLTITHSQEQPYYKKKYIFTCKSPEKTEKIYVIDSEEYSTMLLAEEY